VYFIEAGRYYQVRDKVEKTKTSRATNTILSSAECLKKKESLALLIYSETSFIELFLS
jgi:hypothetical protein